MKSRCMICIEKIREFLVFKGKPSAYNELCYMTCYFDILPPDKIFMVKSE